MSLQDNLSAEAEFIGSVVAELEAEQRRFAHHIDGKTYTTLVGEFPNIEAYKTAIRKAYGSLRGVRVWDITDRRDDITTPETTYGFPPATLSW